MPKVRFLVPLLMGKCCRAHSTYSERKSKVDPDGTPEHFTNWWHWEFDLSNRHHWSFEFTYASTSSKCILFAIRCLFQLDPFIMWLSVVEWIVSEMIDWLKVCDPVSIRKYFVILTFGKNQTLSHRISWSCHGGWKMHIRNWRGYSDSEAEVYWSRAATICRMGKRDPNIPNYVIWVLTLNVGWYLLYFFFFFLHCRVNKVSECMDRCRCRFTPVKTFHPSLRVCRSPALC